MFAKDLAASWTYLPIALLACGIMAAVAWIGGNPRKCLLDNGVLSFERLHEALAVVVQQPGDAVAAIVAARLDQDAGDVLCADGLDDHYPSCTLSPAAPTRLRINVVNRGDVWTKVQVLTN